MREGDRSVLENKSKRAEERRQKFEGQRSQEMATLKTKKQQKEENYLSKAGAAKAQALAIRERARAEKNELLKAKAANAKHERSNDHLVQDVRRRERAPRAQRCERRRFCAMAVRPVMVRVSTLLSMVSRRVPMPAQPHAAAGEKARADGETPKSGGRVP